jgi:hypothetical protein
MRTTLDIPDREHALFSALARERKTSFSRMVVELAMKGLKSQGVGEAPPSYSVDAATGLPQFRSGHPVTAEDVKLLEDEELDRYGPFA